MDIQTALINRATIHNYVQAPIPEEHLRAALEAAVFAPNHKLTFPWRFTRVGRATREKVADLNVSLKQGPEGAPLGEKAVEGIRGAVLNPAEMIVPSLVRTEDAFRAREDYAAIACAIQNLMLSLWGNGIGTKWTTGGLTRVPEIYSLLGIDPAAEEIVGFIWAGIASGEQKRPSRPPVEQFLREVP